MRDDALAKAAWVPVVDALVASIRALAHEEREQLALRVRCLRLAIRAGAESDDSAGAESDDSDESDA